MKVGDIVQSVESGWLGLVQEVYPNEEGEMVARCWGIDTIYMTIKHSSFEEASCPDDQQWFTESDLKIITDIHS